MRAVVVEAFGPVETAQVAELPVPEPGPGQVLIEAKAFGVNYPDMMVIEGTYQFKPPLPFIPGKELAGIISKVGPGVDRWKPGDRVIGQVEYGAWAEYVAIDENTCLAISDKMSFEQATSMGMVYQTAWFALFDRGQFGPGDVVLVTGASGGVGLAAVQIVQAMGGTVLAGVGSPEKMDAVRAAGADHIIDLSGDDLRESVRAEVFAATDGHGADICLDMVGGDVFEACMRGLAWRGRMVVVGFTSGTIPTIKAGHLLVKNIAVAGIQWSDYRDKTPEIMADAQARMMELFDEGKLGVELMKSYPMDRFAAALTAIRERRVVGKVALIP